jgi:hypothetical protein
MPQIHCPHTIKTDIYFHDLISEITLQYYFDTYDLLKWDWNN